MLTCLRMNDHQGEYPVGEQVRGLRVAICKVPVMHLIEYHPANNSFVQIVHRVCDQICYQLYRGMREE